ncbi:MAG: hypothetical protein AAGH76_16215 [Pseudomonadota bacterium]
MRLTFRHWLSLAIIAFYTVGCVSLPAAVRDQFEAAAAADNHFVADDAVDQ